MGNTAIIKFEDYRRTSQTEVYLHWNGGPESVVAFLDYTKQHVRLGDYFIARFVQVIGNFFGGDVSLGVGNYDYQAHHNYHVKMDVSGVEIVSYNGREFDCDAARDHSYWRGEETIMDNIAKKNDPFFCPAKT